MVVKEFPFNINVIISVLICSIHNIFSMLTNELKKIDKILYFFQS